MKQKSIEFSVECVAEIGHHIGKSWAHIVAVNADNWHIECVTNDYDSERSGESVCDGLYAEIEAEVKNYFAKATV